MAVAFRSSSNTGNDALASSQAPAVPAGAAAGDIVVMFLSRWGPGANPAVTAPTGFTLKGPQVLSGDGAAKVDVFWKRLTAADTGSYTFSWADAMWSSAEAICFTGGLSSGDPITAPSGWSGTAGTFGDTSVTADAGAGLAWSCYNDTAAAGGHTPPSGFTEVVDVDCSALAYRIADTSGTQTASGGSVITSSSSAAILVAVAPEPTGPGEITGAGAATAGAAQVAGTGAVQVAGAGAASAAPATVAGTGSLGAVQIVGSGTAAAAAAQVSGTGTVAVTGAGTAQSGAAQAAGVGDVPVSGSGAATAPAAVVAGRESPPGPFVAAASGLHFVDHDGNPILVRGDTVWPFPVNIGRWNGGDWQGDVDAYFTARAAQGYNAVYHNTLGSLQNNGPTNDGATFDGILPFVDGEPGDFNEPYWQRVDYILDVAGSLGFTCFVNFAYSDDLNNAALSGKSEAQCNAYGVALGTRYGNRPNLVWGIGGDYFGEADARVTQILTGIRSTGDTHLIAIQYYPETTSRRDLADNSTLTWGDTNAQFNFVYTYNVTYFGMEQAHAEPDPIPVLWGDGSYDNDSATDRLIFRNHTWWAFTSGSRGSIYGAEGIWGWGSGALAQVQNSASGFADEDLPAIRDTFAGLPGWHLLLPDLDSSLVTAGRGTRATSLSSGGGGGEYTGGNDYVTAGVAPDGSLAVIYCPTSSTITVDDTELVADYTATWIDPVSGATTAATVGSSYTTPGANSVGNDDWVLVLQADASVTGTGSVTAPAASVAGSGTLDTPAATGAGAVTAPAAAVAGAGSVIVAGLGALAPSAAAVSGTGNIGALPITGSGAATAPGAVISGSGTVEIDGGGSLVTSSAIITGAGAVVISGGGGVVVPAARVAGNMFGPTTYTWPPSAGTVSVEVVASAGAAVAVERVASAGAVTVT